MPGVVLNARDAKLIKTGPPVSWEANTNTERIAHVMRSLPDRKVSRKQNTE